MSIFGALKANAEYLLNKIEHGKSYLIRDVDIRLKQASAQIPEDSVIKTFSGIIDKMAQSDPSRILTQKDINSMYQELIGLNRNTRFREVLGDLLPELPQQTAQNHHVIEEMRDTGLPPLDNKVEGFDELNDLFTVHSDKYDAQNAARAKNKVEKELIALGFKNGHVSLVGGNSQALLFSAQLDTHNGVVPIYIPVEASGNSFPDTFIGVKHAASLTASNLYQYIKKVAEYKNRIPDLAEYASIETTKYEVPNELRPLTAEMEESVIESSLGYPMESVSMAKKMVLAELNSMGFRGTQLKIASSTQDGFICEAVLNSPQGKIKIEVPIEMHNNRPLLPSVFAKGDYIDDFTEDNLHALVYKEAGKIDGAIASDHQFYAMSFQELIGTIHKCALDQRYEICDDALEVIADRFDEDVYRRVVADYRQLLSTAVSVEQNIKNAYNSNEFMKTPTSSYPIHKRLGLPAHKLIQDKNGVWHRKDTYMNRAGSDDLSFIPTIGDKIKLGD